MSRPHQEPAEVIAENIADWLTDDQHWLADMPAPGLISASDSLGVTQALIAVVVQPPGLNAYEMLKLLTEALLRSAKWEQRRGWVPPDADDDVTDGLGWWEAAHRLVEG